MHVETLLHWHEKVRGVGWMQRVACRRGALEFARIVVVGPGHATDLVSKGERIAWLKLESRHYEFLSSDNSEEFRPLASWTV